MPQAYDHAKISEMRLASFAPTTPASIPGLFSHEPKAQNSLVGWVQREGGVSRHGAKPHYAISRTIHT